MERGRTRPDLRSLQDHETREREPRIVVEFFFGAHHWGADIDAAKASFDRADVIVPEVFGWDDEYLQLLRDYASGARTRAPQYAERLYRSLKQLRNRAGGDRRRPDGQSATQRELDWIARSGKTIALVDVREDDPSFEALAVLEQDEHEWRKKAKHEFLEGHWAESLRAEAEAVELSNRWLSLRDMKIAENLRRELRSLPEMATRLRGRSEIHVLVLLGAGHMPVYHDLQVSHSVKRTMSHAPFVFTPQGQATRAARYGRRLGEDALARSVWARIILDRLVPEALQAEVDTQTMMVALRRLASSGTLEDLRELSRALGGAPDAIAQQILMTDAFRRFRVLVPRSRREVQDLVAVSLGTVYKP